MSQIEFNAGRLGEGETLRVTFPLRDPDRVLADPAGAITCKVRHYSTAEADGESLLVTHVGTGIYRVDIETEGRAAGRWFGRFLALDPDVAVHFRFTIISAKV